ncbi:MAG TPA: DUF1552 domain-containing protein [Polyangiaceae bacterium]
MRRSYRLARRSFLAAVGGAVGLRILLRNLEAGAQGTPPPPRFLMTHWPVGTIKYHFLPTGSGSTYTTSRILQPFEEAGLREDMIVLYGLNCRGIDQGCGGGHESGTPMVTTGTSVPGTRSNGGEADDGVAGGPSFDQIFLKHVPALKTDGLGYANAICDARVDSQETSTQCLSYGYTKNNIAAARVAGGCGSGRIDEAVPLLPELSPLQLYNQLFGSFMPGADDEELRRALAMRKSVLDYSLDEFAYLRTVAPHDQLAKIEQHETVVRKIEMQLAAQIENGSGAALCTPPAAPPNTVGESGSMFNYNNEETSQSDEGIHQQVGELHAGIIRAAFQCDLIRVATFQWSPGTNHVSFANMYPNANKILMHHPLSHRIGSAADTLERPPSGGEAADVIEFLVNVQTWYNARTAELINSFKDATDIHGGNLLDYTVIPYITEVAETTHRRDPLPAMIFGGRALGMQGGQFQNFESGGRSINDLWMTIAQAYLGTSDPLPAFEDEVFFKEGVSPIEGLWSPPA